MVTGHISENPSYKEMQPHSLHKFWSAVVLQTEWLRQQSQPLINPKCFINVLLHL